MPPLVANASPARNTNVPKYNDALAVKPALFDLTRFTGLAKGELPFWVVIAGLLCTGLALARHLGTSPRLQPGVVFMLLALCCLSAGGVVGFLFGIPHVSPATQPVGSGANGSTTQPSTSLEQVSDWLTKIIIGVGLVELSEIANHLATLGKLIGRAAGINMVVPQLLVVIFAVIGFLAAYIWTRIYYANIQARADNRVEDLDRRTAAIEERTQQLATEATETKALVIDSNQRTLDTAAATSTLQAQTDALQTQGAAQNAEQATVLRQAIRSNAAKTVAAPVLPPQTDAALTTPPDQWNQQLAKFMAAPATAGTDPSAQLFGPLPAADNQRQLSVTVISTSSVEGGQVLFLKAEMTGTPDRTLTGDVTFLLNPDAPKRAVEIPADSSRSPIGCATYSFYTQVPFTLVGMADAGATVLGYDLAQLVSVH
ncbi:hypothetical protein A8B98_20450 [Hymenobacter sp. UV11]|nr:hypothetical protein A8B98_20450 [Hymenobacter sp. UV11]